MNFATHLVFMAASLALTACHPRPVPPAGSAPVQLERPPTLAASLATDGNPVENVRVLEILTQTIPSNKLPISHLDFTRYEGYTTGAIKAAKSATHVQLRTFVHERGGGFEVIWWEQNKMRVRKAFLMDEQVPLELKARFDEKYPEIIVFDIWADRSHRRFMSSHHLSLYFLPNGQLGQIDYGHFHVSLQTSGGNRKIACLSLLSVHPQ